MQTCDDCGHPVSDHDENGECEVENCDCYSWELDTRDDDDCGPFDEMGVDE